MSKKLLLLFAVFNLVTFEISSQDYCGFHYKKEITISGSKVIGGPHINFPVLISHTDTDLTTASGKVTDGEGDDIVFTDNSGNFLEFQKEYYDGSTGRYIAWVKFPSITSGADIKIQMYYGKPTITTDQSTTNVWSSGYEGVWHFNQNVTDHSDKGITSTNNGTSNIAGKIGQARSFTRPNNWVELSGFPNRTSNFTISGWIYTTNNTAGGQRIFCDDLNNSNGYALSLGDPGAGVLRFFSRGSNPVSLDAPSNIINNNTWYHVAAVADITNKIKTIYINGVAVASGSFTGDWGVDAGNTSIGGEVPGGESVSRFQGSLDEVRMSSRTLSTNWIATEHANQNQPTTTVGSSTAGDFYTVGSEVFYGNPSEFGDNTWNAYCYNLATYNATTFNLSDYRGFYTQSGTNVNSSNSWGISSNPSTATGYTGCSITNDLHIVQYKREGFTCGYYQINIAGPSGESGHDDAAKLIIDGTQVWSNTGCCAARNNVWRGYLGSNTQVEFIWSDNGGESYGRATFIRLDHPTVSPDVTICAGTNTTLTASNAANYNWNYNTTHLTAPFTSNSIVCAPNGATPSSTETYTVSTTDATTGCVLSNTIDVTIDPLPSTSVTPSSAGPYCASGTTNAIASGANTYTWSPMTGVSVNSASGHDATITASTTTTYTVTGSNNCASNSATITINIDTPVGDPSIYGDNTWNVYAYNGNNFNTYFGNYEHNSLDFDTRTLWADGTSPSFAPDYAGCDIPVDQHSFRYKRKGFECGFYQLDIPNHDDNVDLYIDGNLVFSQAGWFNNTYKANVWQGYLGEDTEIEYTIREGGGGSNGGLAFIYLHGPENSPNETVWNGSASTNWFTSTNWCGVSPSETVSAYIPNNTTNSTVIINAEEAATNSIFIQSGVTLMVNPTRNLDVYGDWINNGTLTPNSGTISFVGSNPVNIGGSTTSLFTDLTINNTNALTLSQNIQLSGTITFMTGNISTGAYILIFTDNSTASGASDNSHVSGLVRKIGNDAFTFPVGKNNKYAPVSISAPTDVSHYFETEYFDNNPNVLYDTSMKSSGVDHVSSREYWNISRNSGLSSDVTVSLSWTTARSGTVTNMSDLIVSHWNGTEWENLGQGSSSGSNATGIISTNAVVSSFSPFTIGSTTADNPLPIELISFEASIKDKKVNLVWSTISELNNDFFTLEKSLDGVIWMKVAVIKGAGNSNQLLHYHYSDNETSNGISYYRLKQTDFDGTVSYSQIKAIDTENLQRDQLQLYPNPIIDNNSQLHSNREIINGTLKIMNLNGLILFQQNNIYGKTITIDSSILKNGIYIVEIIEPIATSIIKLVKN